MARLPHNGKPRRKGYKQKGNIEEVQNIQDTNNSRSQNNVENCYPKHWLKWLLLWLGQLTQIFYFFVSKFSSIKNATENNQKKGECNVEDRIKVLERNLNACLEKIKSLESAIALLTEEKNYRTSKDPVNQLPVGSDSRTLSLDKAKLISVPPPAPPPPPPLPALLPTILNSGSVRSVLSRRPSNANKPLPAPITPRPLISLDDIARVKLKKTPYVQKTEKNDADMRISLEALRSVKLRKTNFENFRTSPSKAKSPTFKVNSRLSRRALIDSSPRVAPSKNNSNLFGEDLTPMITCALKKRFDALNFSFEEDKENQEPFSF